MTGLLLPYYNYTAFVLSATAAAAIAWMIHPHDARGAKQNLRIGQLTPPLWRLYSRHNDAPRLSSVPS